MIKPLKHFHELSKSEQRRIVISDLEKGEMAMLYPQPPWCNHVNALDRQDGCLVLAQGFVTDDVSICKICDKYKGEK